MISTPKFNILAVMLTFFFYLNHTQYMKCYCHKWQRPPNI